jgi:serine/threonine protein phosphatase PrpC
MKNDEIVYANIVHAEDYNEVNLTTIPHFPVDYILRCVDGPYEGRQIKLRDLGENVLIGTDESCNFFIKDVEVSSKHCLLTLIPNTIYYTLKDLGTQYGTWLKISNFEEGYEIPNNTQFKLFHHSFELIETEGEHYVKFTEGTKKGTIKKIEKDCNISIGRKDAMIEVDLPCLETHSYFLVKKNGKVYVVSKCLENTNNGLFYRLPAWVEGNDNTLALVRAGDVIKIGRCVFRLVSYNWGFFTEIGDRPHQEDKSCIIDDLRIFDEIMIPYYAVYDGHNGGTCSSYLQKYFHHNLRDLLKVNNLSESKNFFADFCKTVQDAIIYTDVSYYDAEPNFSIHHGSTCVSLFFVGNRVLCVNLGDSISILVRNNQKIYLSKDFKPSREKEKGRIEKKKGWISDNRLLGIISVSRGFGDWRFKDPKKQEALKKQVNKPFAFDEYLISNRAEFRMFEIDPTQDEYIILVSDGIFQHTNSNTTIFDTINKYLSLEKGDNSVKNIPNVVDNVRLDIINNIYAGTDEAKDKSSSKDIRNRSAVDNMTLILIHLQNNKN